MFNKVCTVKSKSVVPFRILFSIINQYLLVTVRPHICHKMAYRFCYKVYHIAQKFEGVTLSQTRPRQYFDKQNFGGFIVGYTGEALW